MNGHSLSAQEVEQYRTTPEADLSESGVTQHARAVEPARECIYASGAKSGHRAAAPRTRA